MRPNESIFDNPIRYLKLVQEACEFPKKIVYALYILDALPLYLICNASVFSNKHTPERVGG